MHKFELAGAEAGKTVNKGGFQFTDGVYEHVSEDQTVEGLAVFLARSYYAFPVGSQALKDANERYEREQKSGKTEATDTEVATGAAAEQPSETVKEAVSSLDHADDAHWTQAGLPSTDAVSDLAGETVSRSQIEAAAPGYNRAAAKAAANL